MTRTDAPVATAEVVQTAKGGKDLTGQEKQQRADAVKRASGSIIGYIEKNKDNTIRPLIRTIVGALLMGEVDLDEKQKAAAARSVDADFAGRVENLHAEKESFADQIREGVIDLIDLIEVMSTRSVTLPGGFSAMEIAQAAAGYRAKQSLRMTEIADVLRAYAASK